ncbi:MAG TPA: nitroreductase family protein, partial [Flavobacterium sp.]|nr:nitroreductase family protein [Flavobacterium sp.]
MSQFIQNQNWRYSTKRFDATRKLSADDLDMLKEAIRLSTSSYGLQPYKVLIIEDPELREKLKPAAPGNHSQITDASQLFVFANVTNLGDAEIDSYISNIVETRGVTL